MLALIALLATAAPREALARDSVYRIDPVVDGTVIVAGAAGTLIPYLLASHLITPRCPCDPLEVNAFDRHVIGNQSDAADLVSTLTAGAAVVVPAAADALALGFRRELLEDAVVFSEVLAVNGAVVALAKYTVQRPLPRTYQGDPALLHSPGGYRSFYSGHTSLTFAALGAAAYTLDARWSQGVWPWLVTAAVGTSVGVERIAAGRHFYTDVMVGAAMGTLFGVGIPWLHERKGSLSVAPGELGLTVRFE